MGQRPTLSDLQRENEELRAELAVASSRAAHLDALMEGVLEGIITIDERGVIDSFNAAAEHIFGYNAPEVVGQNVSTLMPEPYRSEHDDYLATYLRTGVRKVIGTGRTVTGRRKDGSQFPAELGITEVETAHGRKFVGLIRDITERRRAEEKLGELVLSLEHSRDDLAAILNSLRQGVIVMDAAGGISFLNRSCQDYLGLEDAEVYGHSWENVCPFSQEDKVALRGVLEGARNGEASELVTVRLESRDGQPRWLDLEVRDDPRGNRGKVLFVYDVSELHVLRQRLAGDQRFTGIVGRTEVMQRVFEQIELLAKVDASVLVTGETGTGKELVARALHEASPRSDGPFVAVNCAGLTESLVASQLFGHRRGSFTGAVEDRPGVFEAAHGGTLFLDEIGDVPSAVQTNLLRVLQEREVVRVGDTHARSVDVRLVAATNRNLRAEVEAGRFRLDLLYRVRVAEITVPPLRDRREDIPLLARHFLAELSRAVGRKVDDIDAEALRLLMSHEWPGNVRELRNAIESALAHCNGTILRRHHLPSEVSDAKPRAYLEGIGLARDRTHGRRERLLEALEITRGNRAAAARLLGIGRTTLYRLLREYGLVRDD